MSGRIHLDRNAGAPLRAEARAAMAAAMDVLGNPSSVHAEGRAARAMIERARRRVADAVGAGNGEVVFTSGATEAAALALAGRGLAGSGVEHDCVRAWVREALPVDGDGAVTVADPGASVLQAANSETGVIQALPPGLAFVDAAQAVGKVPFAFDASGARAASVSAHKLGGPAGVGALVLAPGAEVEAMLRGGGQEMGRRAGTENLIGIAGFGAAVQAAVADVGRGVWEAVDEIRNILESALEAAAPDLIVIGSAGSRLPNTTMAAVPGWRAETQVMQMDLAGFAISAGSACSSGKVRKSQVLAAMGCGPEVAVGAVRVSLGPETTREDVLRFAEAWGERYGRFRARAA